MRKPARYDMERTDYEEFEMVKQSLGDYVEFDDYQELQDRYEDLKVDYENLRAAVTDVYRNM